EKAVTKRLLSDVPLGAFLSGGIDSTAIVGIMAHHLDHPVQTFTIGFEDPDGFDERPFATLAAGRHATDHHEFVVHPDALGVAGRGLPDAYRSWISYVGDYERDELLEGHQDAGALEDYRAIWASSEGAYPLDRLIDLNLPTYLLDDLLVKADRMSMAHGLEVR